MLLHLAKKPGKLSDFPLSLGPPCGTLPSSSGTHRFEVTWAGDMHINKVDVVFNSVFSSFLGRIVLLQIKKYGKSFRNTYMILLNVLDESWIIELCRVIAAGR